MPPANGPTDAALDVDVIATLECAAKQETPEAAAFIISANPKAVLALIADNRALTAERDALRTAVEDARDALKRAISLRVLGYNECHASLCPHGTDRTGTSEATYAGNAEGIENQIRAALAAPAPDRADRTGGATVPLSDREAQRRSFAYGNANIENLGITRKMIDEAAESIEAENRGGAGKAVAWVAKTDDPDHDMLVGPCKCGAWHEPECRPDWHNKYDGTLPKGKADRTGGAKGGGRCAN